MASLEGKVALVTGAAQGLGRAAAERIAADGARVVISDVKEEAGERACEEIRAGGGEASFVRCDVSSSAEVAAMVAAVVERHGRIDCAVNNAGIGGEIAPTAEYSEEFWDRVIAVNLKGVFLCMQQELRRMTAQGAGAIVNVASIYGLVGGANSAGYTAAKHGVVGLTKSAALEVAAAGVRVNAVGPGFSGTPLLTEGGLKLSPGSEGWREIEALHPMNRLAEPSEVAEAIAWLCSDAASFVTGHTLAVDGGFVAR